MKTEWRSLPFFMWQRVAVMRRIRKLLLFYYVSKKNLQTNSLFRIAVMRNPYQEIENVVCYAGSHRKRGKYPDPL